MVSKLSYAAVKGGGCLQLGEATSTSKSRRPGHWAGRGRHGEANYYSAKLRGSWAIMATNCWVLYGLFCGPNGVHC